MAGTTPKKAIRLTQEDLLALVAGRSDKEIADHIRSMVRPCQPFSVINYDTVASMAEWGCSLEMIAATQGITKTTLINRLNANPKLRALLDMGRKRGDAKLMGAGFREALKGNTGMRIWLGKQRLGERDNLELTGAHGGAVQVEHSVKPDFSRLSLEEKRQLLVGLQKVIAPPAVSHTNGHAADGAPTYEVIDAEVIEDSAA